MLPFKNKLAQPVKQHADPRKVQADLRTPADERELRRMSFVTEKGKRLEVLNTWRQRDYKMIKKLREMWAEHDKKYHDLRRLRMLDCMCSLCGRPFTAMRKPKQGAPIRCPSCARYVRLQGKREYYRRKHDGIRATQKIYYDKTYKKKDGTTKLEELAAQPAPKPVVRSNSGPAIVWTPSD